MAQKVESNVDFQGTAKIVNLPDPSSNQDAATKKYVDDNAGGGSGLSRGKVLAQVTTCVLP